MNAKRPAFTDDELALVRSVVSSEWDAVAYDVLQAVADDKGKDINAVTVSRAVAIEVALDAGRPEARLDARRQSDTRAGRVSLVTDDLLARWDRADYRQKIAIVKPAFSYTRYGL